MSKICGLLALLLFLLTVTILNERARHGAPDPYAFCKAMSTKAERDQCEHLLDFALTAGW